MRRCKFISQLLILSSVDDIPNKLMKALPAAPLPVPSAEAWIFGVSCKNKMLYSGGCSPAAVPGPLSFGLEVSEAVSLLGHGAKGPSLACLDTEYCSLNSRIAVEWSLLRFNGWKQSVNFIFEWQSNTMLIIMKKPIEHVIISFF